MKITDREKSLLYVLLMVALVVAAYIFGYRKLVDSADELDEEYNELYIEYSDLAAKEKNLDKYRTDEENYKKAYDEIIAGYFSGYAQEYIIRLIMDIESATGVWLSQTGFSQPVQIYTFGNYSSSNPSATGYVYSTDMVGFRTDLTFTYETTYEGLKKVIEYINNSESKYTIHSVDVSYSEDGIARGSLILSHYAVTGSGRTPENVTFPDVHTGKDNIFWRADGKVTAE